MLISDPRLSPVTRLKLYIAAYHDAKACQQQLASTNELSTNTVKALAAKAREACVRERTRFDAAKFENLRGLYSDYMSALNELKALRSQRDQALGRAKSTRLPGDEALNDQMLGERIAARAKKPNRKYSERIDQLQKQLQEFSRRADQELGLPKYEHLRASARAHCEAAVCHNYDWPAQVYARYMTRRLGVVEAFEVPVLEIDFQTTLDQTLPAMDFAQHRSLE